jgi:hypothetical protein
MSTRPFFEAAFDPIAGQTAVSGDDRQADPRRATDACACGLASDGAPGDAYNEEAFRYFLDVERRRAELSNRPFVLLLVDMKTPSPASREIEASSAQKLLSALSVCVRETDFIGWYRDRAVAGAVLTQHADTAGADLQEAVHRRITRVLGEHLPPDLASMVRVRVYQLPSSLQIVS